MMARDGALAAGLEGRPGFTVCRKMSREPAPPRRAWQPGNSVWRLAVRSDAESLQYLSI
jgi:hypothetical protein